MQGLKSEWTAWDSEIFNGFCLCCVYFISKCLLYIAAINRLLICTYVWGQWYQRVKRKESLYKCNHIQDTWPGLPEKWRYLHRRRNKNEIKKICRTRASMLWRTFYPYSGKDASHFSVSSPCLCAVKYIGTEIIIYMDNQLNSCKIGLIWADNNNGGTTLLSLSAFET